MKDHFEALTRWKSTEPAQTPAGLIEFQRQIIGRDPRPDQLAAIVQLAYRLTRFSGRARGTVFVDGLLGELDEKEWISTVPVPSLATKDPAVAEMARIMIEFGTMPLDPPLTDKKRLGLFVVFMSAAGKALKIHTDPARQHYLTQLLDPRAIADLWPPREEILRFEALLVEAAWDLQIEHGDTKAALMLREQLGIEPREARELLRMARAEATRELGDVDLDQERTVLLAQFRKIYHDALEAMDYKTARNTLRDMANVLGLTRSVPDDLLAQIAASFAKPTKVVTLDAVGTPESAPLELPAHGTERPAVKGVIEMPVRYRKPE